MQRQGTPVELIGEHCSLKGCNQLDFLPYVCEVCGQTFCGEHRLPETHDCKPKQVTEYNTSTSSTTKQLPTCSKTNCRHISVTRCIQCNLSFCATHRNPDQHRCIKKEPEKSKKLEKPKSNILEKLANKFQNHWKTEKSKTATRVFHMKQKTKAIGNPEIPMEDRVYLYVSVDTQLKESSPLSLYYSKNMTMGQVLDKVCEMIGIINRNHENKTKRLVLLDDHSHKPIASSSLLSEWKEPGMLSLTLTEQDTSQHM
ncbi:AN1-type zinc finger protein 1 [Galdieria sulphuraria]|uniref:Zinc finger protein n=1 Tax=Galdieria sulphuraria TaxID=130081 RepID=M2WTV5_GALSU|nr:zinc finger protein [Galdieria sulphuraria]EME27335.1 zinc finger protein [Galdieria sulphuraria]GJD09488.1 AN1-type zinc finger protein 1 [Galdieria sulphuraria]|eukprot:XP_005703855.1 zinc finger protein [Galdieria sulphuraria]